MQSLAESADEKHEHQDIVDKQRKNNPIDECTVINGQLMDQIKQLEVALVKSNATIANLKQQRDRMKAKTRMLKVKLEKYANWSIKQSTESAEIQTIPADRCRIELPKMAVLKKLKTCKSGILSLGDVSLLGVRSRTVAEHLTEELRNAADFIHRNQTTPSEREISLQQKLEKMEVIYQQLNNKVDYLETVGNRIRKTSDNLWSTCQQLWCWIWPALPENLSIMQVAENFRKLNTTNSHNDEKFNSSTFAEVDILSIKQRVSDLLKQREKIVSCLVAMDYIEEPLNSAISTEGCISIIEEQLALENIVLTEELFNYKEEILKLKQKVNHLDSTILTLRRGVESSDKELKIYRDLCYQLENEMALFQQNPHCVPTEQDLFNLILQINQALSECKNITCQLGNERSELLKQNLDLIDQLSQAKMTIISSRQRAIKKHKKHLAIFQNIIKKLTEKFQIQINEIPLNGNECQQPVMTIQIRMLHWNDCGLYCCQV
ncbi:Laminin subunit [Trichinella spiralis]|uniref:Laminin subunit n=1 Tax=Trichinella spiralis TaxID=6334 RepID=A0ABR3K2W2_TRISP